MNKSIRQPSFTVYRHIARNNLPSTASDNYAVLAVTELAQRISNEQNLALSDSLATFTGVCLFGFT